MVSVRQMVKEYCLPVINWWLRPLSLRLMGRGDPNRTFAEFISHLSEQGIKFETVIDVGVAYGTNALYQKIPKAKFILVEPVPKMASVLQKISRRVNAQIHSVAAGSHDGEVVLNIHDDVSGSSVLPQVEGPKFDGRQQVVPLRRLDTLIAGESLKRPVLLKIDTQGFELEVLRGAQELMDKVDVALIECSFHQFRNGAPEVLDIMMEMDALGFIAYETLEGHYRILDSALAQVDVAFVPKDSPLRVHRGMFKGSAD